MENKALTKTNAAPVATQKPSADKPIEYIPFGSDAMIRLTINIVRDTIAVQTKSGKLPSDKDIIKFMMMCQAQRLNPYAGDAYLCGYDSKDGPSFSLITAHQALLKRAEVSDFFLGMQSGIIVLEGEEIKEIEGDFYTKEQEPIGGWAKVYHAKRKDFPFYRRIRMERFCTGCAQWAKDKDPAGMICKCAEADSLRSAFPTMLGGLYLAEEQTLPTDIGATVETVSAPSPRVRPLAPPTAKNTHELIEPRNIRAEFQAFLDENEIPFNIFKVWAEQSGNIENADSVASLDEIKEADLERLLKSKAGLLTGLNEVKAGAAR